MRKDASSSERAGRGEGAGMDFGALTPFASPGLEAAVHAGNVWMKGVASFNEEVLSFSHEQLGKCMDAGQSLLRCTSVEQALSTQSDLARNALESYSREASKLLSMTAELAREAWTPAPSGGASAGED